MRFSCLVPCFNSVQFIDQFIQSYQQQTIKFDELIFYDDASLDNTADYLESAGYNVIRGLENKGPSFARNRLLESATGDWIHFHDADDVLDPLFLEGLKDFITDTRTQILCNCGVKNSKGDKLGMLANYTICPQDDSINYFLENLGLAIIGLYNRSFLISSHILFREDLRFNEDPDFHVRLASAGAKFQSVSKTLVYIIGHPESSSLKHWWSCISNQIFCLNSYSKILPPKYKPQLARKLADLAYYALRSKKSLVAHRAIYSLKVNFENKFTFSNKRNQFISELLSHNLFIKVVVQISKII